MSILVQLEQNKGTVSSALGKSLAKEVLAGNPSILAEAVELLVHDNKQVRAGAAKIIEQVAVEKPVVVSQYLPRLLPALDVPEPQTRWMAIHTIGLCAEFDIPTAEKAFPKAKEFIEGNSGACLWGSTIIYLGCLGATSPTNAHAVFPILEQALRNIPGQTKNVLDSFLRICDTTQDEIRAKIASYADTYAENEKTSLKTVARKIRKKIHSRTRMK